MDNLIQQGEKFLQDQSQGQNQNQNQNGGQQSQPDGQQGQEQQQQQQQQDSQGGNGGGMMKSFEQNAGNAYINQEVNSFLTKEGVPSSMDGTIDGAIDTEINKLESSFGFGK